MRHYLWFRVSGKVPDLGWPFYLGHGAAFNPHYNIREVWQEPMPDHVVVKISLSAGGAVAVNSQRRAVQPGEAILRFVHDDQIWESYHPNHRGEWEFLGLIFSGAAAVWAVKAMMVRFGRIYPLGVDHPIIRRLMRLVQERDIVTEITASAGVKLVNDVLQALLEAAEASLLERSERITDLAEAVESTMRADLRRDWSVELLARQHGVSREHLTRVFTRRFGLSPHRYLMELRVQEACRRLRSTHDPIKSILMELGFASHASFIRTFRRYIHVSPTAYRERGLAQDAKVLPRGEEAEHG
jgi:AraC-like DNA-binding protein